MDPEEKVQGNQNISSGKTNLIGEELSEYLNPNQNPSPHLNPNINPSPSSNPSTNLSSIYPPNKIPQKPSPVPAARQTIIRTYKSDVEETVASSHLSSVNIALAENKRMMERMKEEKETGKKDKKNYVIILVSFFLVILGVLAVVVPIFFVNQKYAPATTTVTRTSPIITPDSTEDLNLEDLDQTRIAKTLSERVDQTSIRVGTIRGMYLTEKNLDDTRSVVDINKFINLLNFNIPQILVRTLKPDYLFGMHNFIGNQKFLILKVGSYENAYSGMLAWEVDLWKNFKGLFGLVDPDSLLATTTDVFAEDIKSFQDIVIKNKDCRVTKDNSGSILLLYCIPDKETIVITTSQDTFKEILLRMTSKQTVSQ